MVAPHERTAARPPPPGDPPPGDGERARRESGDPESGDDVRAHLTGAWAAATDALGHGKDLARIKAFEVGAGVRSFLLRLVLVAVAVAVALAAAVAAGVWAVLRLLGELAVAFGGGLSGVLLTIAVLAGTVLLGALVAKWLAARAQARRWRAALAPGEKERPRRSSMPRELQRLAAEARAGLAEDGRRLAEHAEGVFRARPAVSLGASAATGFLAARLLMASPRPLRRQLVPAARWLRSIGLAALTNAILQGRGGGDPDPTGNGAPPHES